MMSDTGTERENAEVENLSVYELNAGKVGEFLPGWELMSPDELYEKDHPSSPRAGKIGYKFSNGTGKSWNLVIDQYEPSLKLSSSQGDKVWIGQRESLESVVANRKEGSIRFFDKTNQYSYYEIRKTGQHVMSSGPREVVLAIDSASLSNP